MGALSIDDRHVGTIEAIAPKLDTTKDEAKTDGLPMDKLEGKKFTVQLDDQSIETVKGIHGEFFANEKKLIEEAQQRMEKMLSQHREKLKRIKDGESVWLSFKAWVWAIIIVEVSLLLVGTVIYYIAKAKFT